jgi:hypothetical protein
VGVAGAPEAGAGGEAGGGPLQVQANVSSSEYASVASLDLQELGLPSDLEITQLTVIEGTAEALSIHDGEIRFLTPADSGSDGKVTLRAALTDRDVIIPIVIRSARPSDIVAYVEPSDTGSAGTVPKLKVTGMTATNALIGGAMTFSATGAPSLDAAASTATVYVPITGKTVNLAGLWSYQASTNSFEISSSVMTTLLAQLPASEVEVNIALTSVDGEFAYAWSFMAHKPTATLKGQVVDIGNTPSTSLAGRKIAVRGIDNRTRRVVTVAADGTFVADALVEGTFDIILLDVEAPNFWRATVPIFKGSTTASVSFPYAGTGITTAGNSARGGVVTTSAAGTAFVGPSVLRSHLTQDGVSPASRSTRGDVQLAAATPTGCEVVQAATGTATYTAASAAQNSTITCSAQPAIPQGTSKIGVTLVIASAEYPTYTTAKSQYNDTWSYAVGGLPGLGSDGGAVNDTHYTQGSISKSVCIDVSKLTKDAPYSFQANLAATNIGDSILTTQVTMTVTVNCAAKLAVTSATFSSPNAKGHGVIRPTASGNLINNYVSLPLATKPTDWGIPLKVHFEPKEAKITKVRMGVMVGGVPQMSAEDLLPQATTNAAGELLFGDLILPIFSTQPFAGKTSVLIELSGEVEGAAQTTVPADGAIKFVDEQTFIPLFLVGDQLETARRYGSRDAGGDSWGTYGALQWLTTRAYRFDDISGLHVPQTATGRSALGHAGHSDGTQMDMRYSDGSGGFSDALGGANDGAAILKLLNDAQAEVVAGSTLTPNLTLARAWITANRTMLTTESANARSVYAGPSFMKLALFDGKFPDQTAIPGLTSWATKPANVSFVAPHLHHWHLSLSAP